MLNLAYLVQFYFDFLKLLHSKTINLAYYYTKTLSPKMLRMVSKVALWFPLNIGVKVLRKMLIFLEKIVILPKKYEINDKWNRILFSSLYFF